jgi:hypothetical protein
MMKISYCMRRKPHLSRQEFQDYYRKKHTRVLSAEETAELAMVRYCQLHVVDDEVNELLDSERGGEPAFDAVAEIWVESEDAWRNTWLSEGGQAALAKLKLDEQNFVDWSRSVIFMSRELVMMDGPVTTAADRNR